MVNVWVCAAAGDDVRAPMMGETAGDNKDIMHVLESTLITWTKQIKNVLKQVNM